MTLLTADTAVLLFTVGVGLVFFECNRPGTVLPGALGLLACLLALAGLWRLGINPLGLSSLLLATLLLIAGLLRPMPWLAVGVAVLLLTLGFRFIVVADAESHVSIAMAAVCAVCIGGCSATLSAVARRARRNKGLD